MAAAVEERQRLGQQVLHQLVAEVAQHGFADLVGQADAPIKGDVGNDDGAEEKQQPFGGRDAVARGDGALDDVADDPREHRQGHGAEGAEPEQGVALAAVGLGEREQARDGGPAQGQAVGFLLVGADPADGDLEAGGLAHAWAPSDWMRMARR